jgi:hypothetical protein
VILDTPTLDRDAFEARTGWAIKPEGACKGEVCVPLPDDADLDAVAARLGMPLLHDESNDVWALGPESAVTGRALTTAVAPDFELPQVLTGEPFRLSSLRGQKVLLVAWASW